MKVKDFFSKYISSEEWIIKEPTWDKALQSVRESQFATGNGLIGMRGILEEIPYDCKPGTYVAGLYDKAEAQVTELVNLPNPVNFYAAVNGERLDVVAMDVTQHARRLDFRYGIITRRTIYRDSRKRRYDYQSMRFVSMAERNVGAMQISITPLDDSTNLTIQTTLDTSVSNAGVLTEGRKRHFYIDEVSRFTEGNYFSVATMDKNVPVSYANILTLERGGTRRAIKGRSLKLRLKKGETASFTKIFSIVPYALNKGAAEHKRRAIGLVKKSAKKGLARLIKEHKRAWDKRWDYCDIKIDGDSKGQWALRFNIYHLLICANDDNGRSSIGARTLSGEGYRGHIFWDSEIFMVPFFIYTQPHIARSLLLYRYNRLSEAQRIAKEEGYSGAMFPWESADTGREETPTWHKNLDGTIIKIYTHQMEHHITADIPYSFYKYYQATGDEEFMVRYGFEVLFETARFWASRVEYNKKKGTYAIKHVIGPDEFHINVSNNAFTNGMAKHILFTAHKVYLYAQRYHSSALLDLSRKLSLSLREVKRWKEIAPRIVLNMRRDRVIEQFDGFFKKTKVRVTGLDQNFMPLFPRNVKLSKIDTTQFVKQADVVMLMDLLCDSFSLKTKKKNYHYYLPLTLHKSSLSPATHATVGAEIGDMARAQRYFSLSVMSDIANVHGNTAEGIHAASLGGTWQAVVHGFAGVRIMKDDLAITPRLPMGWKSISLSIIWRGMKAEISAYRDKVKLRFGSKEAKAKVPVRIYGVRREIGVNRSYIFRKKSN